MKRTDRNIPAVPPYACLTQKQKIGLFLICCLLLCPEMSSAHTIIFKDGVSSKAEILDTSGCSITINRNGNKVEIKKSLISMTIDSTDTVRYEKFVCQEKETPSQYKVYKFGESPENRLYGLISTYPRSKSKLDTNQKILYQKYPLSGDYNERAFDSVSIQMASFLSKYGVIKTISINDLYNCITSVSAACMEFRYLVMPYETDSYAKEVTKVSPNLFFDPYSKTPSAGNTHFNGTKKDKVAETQIRFIVVDLHSKRVVFDECAKEKGGRVHFGESLEETVLLQLPDMRERFNRELNENVMDIAEEIQIKLKDQFK